MPSVGLGAARKCEDIDAVSNVSLLREAQVFWQELPFVGLIVDVFPEGEAAYEVLAGSYE